MNKQIDFKDISGISKLFTDFLNNNDNIKKRFPGNNALDNHQKLKERAKNFDKREQLIDAFQNSMSYIDISNSQKSNLKKMLNENTLAIVSGQQVGFLGGPMYSLYKIISSVQRSIELKEKYPDLDFIPVFWIEDNDHDIEEAADISILNNKSEIKDFNAQNDSNESDRTIVAGKIFNDAIIENIKDVIENLPSTSNSEHFEDILKDIYKNGKYWRESFIQLLQRWVGELGVLFICASCLRRGGLFKDTVKKELENAGTTQKLTLAANHELDIMDYHIQANSSPVNLFYHEGDERFRIDLSIDDDFLIGEKTIKSKDLINEAEQFPEKFSPKVLLRPVFQDAILPTVAYIAGPGETGYLAQTKEMFDFFGIPMPAILPRHSFTLIDKKTGKFLEKNDLEPIKFFAKKQDLINEVADKLVDEPLENLFETSRNSIKKIFEEIKDNLFEVDKGLINSADASLTKNLQQIDVLNKKTIASLKRKKEDLLLRYEAASNFIYPQEKMQERVYSPLNFMIYTGEKEFIDLLLEAVKKDPTKHHFIELI